MTEMKRLEEQQRKESNGKTKKNSLAISLLVAATFAAGFDIILLATIPVVITYASIPTDAGEMNENIAATSNEAITLANEPFLVEQGKTVAANPINQTHLSISLVGNGTIMLPNSTETVKTNDTGNAIARLTPTGNIVNGQIHISTEDGSENGTLFFTEIGQNQKGVGVAYFTTNSTGKLSFLNNMIALFQDEVQPNGDTLITAWEWSGE
jgi:L-asparaginase/Glu-tRNA(Gln) amidotransferase subunit D